MLWVLHDEKMMTMKKNVVWLWLGGKLLIYVYIKMVMKQSSLLGNELKRALTLERSPRLCITILIPRNLNLISSPPELCR